MLLVGCGGTNVTPTEDETARPSGTIAERFPGDLGIATDPNVIFHTDFENGFAGWTDYTRDPSRLTVLDDPAVANGGSSFMQASVTRTQLASVPYISTSAVYEFPEDVDEVFWRFYARFEGSSAAPHHWVAVSAGNFRGGGAGQRPDGNEAFWFNLDVSSRRTFRFYVYWHGMRSWMCNDGSTDPGCQGYNGPSGSPYFGNNFEPAGQTGFASDEWFCVEISAKSNTPGTTDGALSLWVDDALVGRYATGSTRGRWLRDNFYTHGQYYLDEQAFEGFDFRTSATYGLNRVVLDAYYEEGTLDDMESRGIPVPEAQVSLYDDVVVATQRIGCKVDP